MPVRTVLIVIVIRMTVVLAVAVIVMVVVVVPVDAGSRDFRVFHRSRLWSYPVHLHTRIGWELRLYCRSWLSDHSVVRPVVVIARLLVVLCRVVGSRFVVARVIRLPVDVHRRLFVVIIWTAVVTRLPVRVAFVTLSIN